MGQRSSSTCCGRRRRGGSCRRPGGRRDRWRRSSRWAGAAGTGATPARRSRSGCAPPRRCRAAGRRGPAGSSIAPHPLRDALHHRPSPRRHAAAGGSNRRAKVNACSVGPSATGAARAGPSPRARSGAPPPGPTRARGSARPSGRTTPAGGGSARRAPTGRRSRAAPRALPDRHVHDDLGIVVEADRGRVAGVVLEAPHEAGRPVAQVVDLVEVVDEAGHPRVAERPAVLRDVVLGQLVRHRPTGCLAGPAGARSPRTAP